MDYEQKIIGATEKTLPAVVSIAASKNVADVETEMAKMGLNPQQFADRLIQESADDGTVTISSGSAFIVDSSGIILTNKHVIADKKARYAAVVAKNHYEIEIVDVDPLADIAILKLKEPPKNLPALALGSSKSIRLGQTAIAIGNALGEFQNTVSVGIISGLSRFLSAITDTEGHHERLRGLIQTDAAINPGNSGGPLVNLQGEAIGINTAVVFGAQNIGFAIPIDRARRDLEALKTNGHIRTPFLGIRYVLLNKKIKEHFRLPVDSGALIVREGLPHDHAVLPGSSASTAGLQEHDIILVANGKRITNEQTLEDILDECAVGDELELRVLRKEKEFIARVTLEDRSKFS
ncbi:hypothetical protein A3J56_03245 [Candidatus Giovannonibacteria bacterium RIFCSPHIGHO2_02_FULL_46_20]|uniref:PDZ domain-containing protein n=1 Tax=Candidatus Giovannonibacteria bacterium RIFCSPHIGHO2_02_FULL_46_20 TaxID=1798338 RepID=A0A1F5WG82_9BACT|nr:MAG: hypothetical protein A3J56_03245 [Candidatus Giovannonibacteria bacterium RIFCSPHIGHO2_02_FULL_46_20]